MLSLLLAAALTFTQSDAELSYNTASNLVVKHTPRDAGTIRGRIAANYLLDEASRLGVNVRRDQFEAKTRKGMRDFVNLYCEFKFHPEGEWIVLLSHYDTKPGIDCPGANDGASTSGLMVGLANMLTRASGFKHNVLLVWTDGEEAQLAYGVNDGLFGSKRTVEWIKKKDYQVRAVICLDMLGDKNLELSVPKNGHPALTKLAVVAGKRAKVPVKPIEEFVRDDHVPFLEADYKAIDLIDFHYGSQPGLNDYWHTSEDTIDKISVESLKKSGSVVAQLINILL